MAFQVYPGGIVDIATLKNTLEKLQVLGITSSTLIMDRGFCSGANLPQVMAVFEERDCGHVGLQGGNITEQGHLRGEIGNPILEKRNGVASGPIFTSRVLRYWDENGVSGYFLERIVI